METFIHKNFEVEANPIPGVRLVYTVRFGGTAVIDLKETRASGTEAISEIKKAIDDFITTLPPALSYKY